MNTEKNKKLNRAIEHQTKLESVMAAAANEMASDPTPEKIETFNKAVDEYRHSSMVVDTAKIAAFGFIND